MTSIAERKRRKRAARISLPGDGYVEQPAPTGRPRKTPEDPRKSALEARCRQHIDLLTPGQAKALHASLRAALAIDGPAERKAAIEKLSQMVEALRMKAAEDPVLDSDMGRCIRRLTKPEDMPQMRNTWAALSASHRNYRLLFIGQTGNPQGAAIAMVPDPMQTDQSLRVDLRTHDEKVAAAKASWAAWQAKIADLPTPLHKWALRGALNGFLGEATLWHNQAPTDKGRAAVDALRRMVG